ncbi:MAG: hypothetical protein PHF86_04795, partial [Candidatus Nanoarchaeia archaeon]|nr:hypothetical protein [Candidatus Nanoarchaeia archaeon]
AGTESERMRITSDGKVGIGTSSPLTDVEIRPHTNETVKLTITGDKTISAIGDEFCSLDFRSGGDPSPLSTDDIVGRIVSVDEYGSGARSGMAFYTTDSVSAPYIKERVRIDTLGRVGIGTTTPTNALDVVGVGRFYDDVRSNGNYVATINGKGFACNGDLYLFAGGGSKTATLTQTGGDFNISGNYYSSGLLTTGNVGIGTTNPLTRLHVQGDSLVRGKLSVNDLEITNAFTRCDFVAPGTNNSINICHDALSVGHPDRAKGGYIRIAGSTNSETGDISLETGFAGDLILSSGESAGTKTKIYGTTIENYCTTCNYNGTSEFIFNSINSRIGIGTDITGTINDSYLTICGSRYGSSFNGAFISLYGNDVSGNTGNLTMFAGNSGNIFLGSAHNFSVSASDYVHIRGEDNVILNSDEDVLCDSFRTGIGTASLNQTGGDSGTLVVYSQGIANIARFMFDADLKAKIDSSGQFYSDAGTTISSPADFAEWTEVEDKLENYDEGVIVQQSLSTDMLVELASKGQPVYGIVTNRATFCGGFHKSICDKQVREDFMNLDINELENKYNAKRVAMTGHVLCKVVGTINRGQKLVISDIPGVATCISSNNDEWFALARQNYNSDEIGLIEVKL